MILSSHGILASQIASFDADAVAFFNRVTTAGGTLSTTEKNAVNALVVQMKTDGIWSKMKAIYPMVGASSAACSQNLKSSSFTGTFTSGWTFASTGVTPNGTSAYMDTGLIPSSSLSQNDKHISSYIRTNANNALLGTGSSASTLLDQIVQVSNSLFGNLSSSFYFLTRTATSGFYLVRRNTSTTSNTFVNNVLVITDNLASTGQSPNAIYLSARNTGTVDFYSSSQCAFASIGDGLTNTEASKLYTAVQAFQTTLSRQV